jgi:hypothetical protein
VNCDCVCACGRIVAVDEVCEERVEDVSELERAEKWSGRMLDMLELWHREGRMVEYVGLWYVHRI